MEERERERERERETDREKYLVVGVELKYIEHRGQIGRQAV